MNERKQYLIDFIIYFFPKGENCNQQYLSECTMEELWNVISEFKDLINEEEIYNGQVI